MSDVGRKVSGRKADVVAFPSEGRDTIPAGGAIASTCGFLPATLRQGYVGMWAIMGEAWEELRQISGK
ncbi:MAG: hypothetical protein ABSF09_11885 [Candidatus Bathyarchaeia archaeon]